MDEWRTQQRLVLVQRFNRVINTPLCQVLHDVGAHGSRAVIRLCDTGTAARPGRLELTREVSRKSADGRFIGERRLTLNWQKRVFPFLLLTLIYQNRNIFN